MIYLVTGQQSLFDDPNYKIISIEESLQLLNGCKVLQYDSETNGRDAHLCDILCIQFGSKAKDFQIVIDTTTINISHYKNILESKNIIGHNLKFDLQFLYNFNIVPRNVYDTMIIEQLLYLGYPSGVIRFSLKDVAKRRLDVDLDKSTRGEIIWRGLDSKVIIYAASDVQYLEDIMHSQLSDCRAKECLIGAKLECDFVPAIAYLEWCGIKLDANKWRAKMALDNKNLKERKDLLDAFVVNIYKHNSNSNDFTNVFRGIDKFIIHNRQGDLFSGFDLEPKCAINWDSSRQVVSFAKLLGFNTSVQDKKTGEDKDSVLEKHLKGQKGINDRFIDLYFDYKESSKVCSTYGQAQLNMINPKTGRCHTVYRQLGASSGRMSCGSQNPNTDLAKVKGIPAKECTYCNFQQLPADEDTRSSFIAEEGNLFCSCDYSALELTKILIHNNKITIYFVLVIIFNIFVYY